MGFTLYFQATRSVPDDVKIALSERAEELSQGRSWLSCEPIGFFEGTDRLMGGVKPNFAPDPEDVPDADHDLPDGAVFDVISILCKLSSQFEVDWEFSHDHDKGPIGFIRDGVADMDLLTQAEAINEVRDIMSGIEGELAEEDQKSGAGEDDDEDEDEDDDSGPHILPFAPIE